MSVKSILRKIIVQKYKQHRMKPLEEAEKTIRLSDPKVQSLIKENIQYKDKYKGERCFVLGNGPSLSDVDFSLLKDEYVFTVNQICRKKEFPLLNTTFHVVADPMFFTEDFLPIFFGVNTENNRPSVFIPREYRSFAESNNLSEELDLHYLQIPYWTTDLIGIKTEMEQCITGFYTVVQYCIAIAMYMGFSEIYLLGCDTTGIILDINAVYNDSTTTDFSQYYTYSFSESDNKNMNYRKNRYTLYRKVIEYSNTLRDYQLLYDECGKRGIKLINCSSKSAIDCLPKMDLSTVLDCK